MGDYLAIHPERRWNVSKERFKTDLDDWEYIERMFRQNLVEIVGFNQLVELEVFFVPVILVEGTNFFDSQI